MRLVIPFCLMLLFAASEASARILYQELYSRASLAGLLDIHSPYPSNTYYSRFPKSDRKLSLDPVFRGDFLDHIYTTSHARIYTVEPGDTLRKIARKFATTIEFIKALNKLKGSRLKSGQRLWIPDKAFTLEINKSLNRLYLKCGVVVIQDYPVSTGKSQNQTPLGVFLIQSRYPFPTWFHKGEVVAAASPDNYLGSRWLGFDKPQFGIHGTIFPELIGQSVSKGCIRMKNEDIEEIYEFIPVGTVVIITEL